MPHHALLYGTVQFSDGNQELFVGGGYEISVIDLAHGLVRVLADGQFEQAPEGSTASFGQADDALTVRFEKQQGQVMIQTDLERSRALSVPAAAFLSGTQQFLEEFGRELHSRARELLDWESLAMLRAYGAAHS